MTATIKTLAALKAATERLDEMEAYVAKADFSAAHLSVYWSIAYGGFAKSEQALEEGVRDLIRPNLEVMVAQVVANARHEVEVLTGQLHVEMGKDGMCVAVEPQRIWPADIVSPRPHPVAPDEPKSLRERLIAGIGRCYPNQMDVVALLKEAAAVVPPGPPPWKSL